MATKWLIKGPEIVTYTCDFGCPCQFNSLPTRGYCRAAAGIQIDEGHYDGVKLNGLNCAVVPSWPQAIHLGHGRASTPGSTFFDVFASTYEKVHEPHRARINLPKGFEYRTCEIASGTLKTHGPIEIEYQNRHCHLAMLNIGPDGPIG